jgi:hypothetical protein
VLDACAGDWMVSFGSCDYFPEGEARLLVLPWGAGLSLSIPVFMAQRARQVCYCKYGDLVVSSCIFVYSPEIGAGLLLVYAPESRTGLLLVLVLAGWPRFLLGGRFCGTGGIFGMIIRNLNFYSIQLGILWIVRVSDFCVYILFYFILFYFILQ